MYQVLVFSTRNLASNFVCWDTAAEWACRAKKSSHLECGSSIAVSSISPNSFLERICFEASYLINRTLSSVGKPLMRSCTGRRPRMRTYTRSRERVFLGYPLVTLSSPNGCSRIEHTRFKKGLWWPTTILQNTRMMTCTK